MLKSYLHYPELNRVPVIDVPITGTNMSECVDFITHNIDDLHGEYICVSNAHTSVMAHDDPSYWSCQAESVMSVPDGKPLSIVGRKTVASMGRVTGPDLMREIFSISAQYGWSHYFYGNERKTSRRSWNRFKKSIRAWKLLAWSLPSFVRFPMARNETFLDALLILAPTLHGLHLVLRVRKSSCMSLKAVPSH